MHRFRKKSDAKKSSISSAFSITPTVTRSASQHATSQPSSSSSQQPAKLERIELLPPESDFRTSLILPDLSRRFSLLRQPDGRAVDIQDVRERFAAQRAKGSPNVITEEEEEFVINYLSNAGHIPGGVVDDRGTDDSQQRSPISAKSTHTPGAAESIRSTASPHSAFDSSFPTTNGPPSVRSRTSHASNSSKRYSNNLFGSGRLKDQQYMRGTSRSLSGRSTKTVDKREETTKTLAPIAQSSRTPVTSGSTPELAEETLEEEDSTRNGLMEGIQDVYSPGEGIAGASIGQAITSGDDTAFDQPSDLDLDASEDSRPITPIRNGGSHLHNDLPAVLPLSPKSPKSPNGSMRGLGPAASPYNTARKKGLMPLHFTTAQVRRASLALEEVIRNFEQDSNAEEEILTPRTPNGNFQGNGYTRTLHPWSRQQSAVSPSVWSQHSKSSTEKEPGSASGKSPNGTSFRTEDVEEDAVYPLQTSQSTSSRSQQSHLSSLARSASARYIGDRSQARLPGYIPGMHRPITPKDADSEEALTPRALSPSTSSFGQPASPKSGATSTRSNSEYSQLPHRRFGSLATFGPSSPLSPISPRSATQGTSTPVQRPPLVSAWSSTTASPISPTAGSTLDSELSAAALQVASMMDESPQGHRFGSRGLQGANTLAPPLGRIDRDTKMSTSSSSILPPSTSSSSLTSLYQSDSGTTMLTSPDFGTSFQGAGPSSPETMNYYPHKPKSPIISARRPSNNGAIIASPPLLPTQSSDSRPDTPLGQMYTGSSGAASPATFTLNGNEPSVPNGSNTTKVSLQRMMSERRAMSPGVSAMKGAGSSRSLSSTRGDTSSLPFGTTAGDEHANRGGASGTRSPPPSAMKGQRQQYGQRHSRSRSRSSLDAGMDGDDQALAWVSTSAMKSGSRAAPPKPILVQSPSASSALALSDSLSSTRGVGSAATAASKLVWQHPIFNSSRSSLISAGSSFHSDGDALVLDLNCGVLSKDEDSSNSPVEATESDHEDLLNCWGGLTRKDLTAIHDKLVDAAVARKRARSPSVTPARSRSPSASSFQPFATRSPSRGHQRQGSQFSTRSLTKESEKSQPVPVPPSPTWSARKDKSTKVNALLQSMVDTLNAPPQPASFIPSPTNFGPDTPIDTLHPSIPEPIKTSDDDGKPPQSANSRRSPVPSFNDPEQRKKALTEALFGETPSPGAATPQEDQHPYTTGHLTVEDLEPVAKAGASTPSPQPTVDELMADVSRRNAAATEALKSPGVPRSESGLKRQVTKRVNARLISGPQPVASSPGADALAPAASSSSASLVHPSSHSPVPTSEKLGSKLSLRIKKLRDKLKTKPVPNGEEITPYMFETRSISPSSSAAGNSTVGHSAVLITRTVDTSPRKSPVPVPQSADVQSFKFPPSSPPPASPTPPHHGGAGLKRFMSRLRSSNSKNDLTEKASIVSSTAEGHDSLTRQMSQFSASIDHNHARPSSPESIRRKPPSVRTDTEPGPQVVDLTSPSLETNDRQFNLSTPTPPTDHTPDETAVRQLFDAASNLGLDKAALNDLLARSASTSSRSTGWTARPGSSATTSTVTAENSQAKPFFGLRREPSTRAPVLSSVSEKSVHPDEGRTILRRTLIFPSEAETALSRRPSQATKASKKKNRFSTQSVQSIRSLQERVPTPPPNRSSRRYSKDPSPPVPALPPGIAVGGSESPNPLRASHKSQNSIGSAYASLFEMYGESESRPSFQAESSGPPSPTLPIAGPGQAIEVVEMSNGEVVWNIVDAMRGDLGIEDDIASFYQNRQSVTSDYSLPMRMSEESARDNVQIFFKEHKRSGSKGSAASTSSRRLLFPPTGNRPETKVFFSSADHIGRLIDAMSRGADAGSFNFLPSRQESPLPSSSASTTYKSSIKTHSPTISMTDSTVPVEDRLEHLLKVTARRI